MTLSKRKRCLQVGDLVKIVDPRPVIRVGYPKTPEDYRDEVEAAHTKTLDTLVGKPCRSEHLADKIRERLVRDLCYLAAKRDGFGGRERSVHLDEPVESMRNVSVDRHPTSLDIDERHATAYIKRSPTARRRKEDLHDRDDRLRTVHFFTEDDASPPNYVARCYYCGTPFEEASP